MSHATETETISLPIINPEDKPTWLGDFNEAMHKIDSSAAESRGIAQNVAALETTVSAHTEDLSNLVTSVETAQEAADSAQAAVNSLESRVVQNEQDIEDIKSASVGSRLVAFGDSWFKTADENGKYIPDHVAEVLGLTCTNYAVGGASFARGSTNHIIDQINGVSESEEEREKVKVVILQGGINDFTTGLTNATHDAIRQASAAAAALYPKATVYVVPFMLPSMAGNTPGWYTSNETFDHQVGDINGWGSMGAQKNRLGARQVLISDGWVAFNGMRSSFVATSPGHPTAQGVYIVARFILAGMGVGSFRNSNNYMDIEDGFTYYFVSKDANLYTSKLMRIPSSYCTGSDVLLGKMPEEFAPVTNTDTLWSHSLLVNSQTNAPGQGVLIFRREGETQMGGKRWNVYLKAQDIGAWYIPANSFVISLSLI